MALSNSAEGGTNGSTVTTSDTYTDSSDAFTGVTVSDASATLVYSNAHPAHGTMGFQSNTRAVTASSYLEWTNASDSSNSFGRAYLYYDVTNSSHSWCQFRTSGGTVIGYIGTNASQKLKLGNGNEVTAFTMNTVLSAGNLYRVEWNLVPGGATATLQVKLFSGDSTTAVEDSLAQTITPQASATAVRTLRIGGTINANQNLPSSTGSLFLDDLRAFDTTWPGPVVIPPTYLRPIMDITVGDWIPTPSSPTTLFDKLDESTASDTDYISGSTTVEVKFG